MHKVIFNFGNARLQRNFAVVKKTNNVFFPQPNLLPNLESIFWLFWGFDLISKGMISVLAAQCILKELSSPLIYLK